MMCFMGAFLKQSALDQMRKDIAASAVADVAEKNNASDVDAAAAADNIT